MSAIAYESTTVTVRPFAAPLRAYAAARRLPIGAAADMSALATDSRYAATLAREFDLVVAENAFKAHEVWTGPYSYDFTRCDALAAFAREHGMALRGHTLLWHQSVPEWLASGTFSDADIRRMMAAYVAAFVGRYRGVVAAWDVINEAISDDGPSPWLRTDSFWYRTLGPDYVADMFRWAHEADPAVPLYYNDYEAEDLCPKSDAIYRLLRELRGRGAPVHGIGLQGHLLNGWRVGAGHRENIRRFVSLGLDWQITEADVRMELNGQRPSEADLAAQADAYRDLIELCLTQPGCTGFLAWGFTDGYSWIPGFRQGWGAALPLDEHFQPKPAYAAIAELLGGR